MIEKIIEQPWLATAFVALIAVLWFAASRRVRRDRLRKHQSRIDRRNAIRAERDRRWRLRD